MNTEQVAIVTSAAVAVLLSGVNVGYQIWLTNRTLKQQTKVSQAERDHQRQLAVDQRVQDRIVSAYEDLLTMVDYVMQVVDMTHPILETEPAPEPPPEQDREAVRRIQARIGAHGSPEVKGILYEKWVQARVDFFNKAEYLTLIRSASKEGKDVKAEYGVHMSEQYQIVQAQRERLHQITRDLEDQVNAELRS